jgi:shikimate dehydrogenase
MYPGIDKSPVDISRFESLSGVVDAVYNPLRTRLVSEAKARGIPAVGGLYMLVAQGVRASEIFLGVSYPVGVTDEVYEKILASKENIVLIGMPSSGKSTVGKILADVLERELYDTDDMIVERAREPITEIFKKCGEPYFRDLEAFAVREAGEMTCRIIATGGGAILRDENVEALCQNGRLFFLDRAPEELIPTDSRPLASDREAIMERYRERYPIYCEVCDEIIKCDGTAEVIAKRIGEKYL